MVNYTAIDTIVNSPTFGQVLSVRPMRSMQANLRSGLRHVSTPNSNSHSKPNRLASVLKVRGNRGTCLDFPPAVHTIFLAS